MDLAKETVNVFVLGDLILDHTIFVSQKEPGTYQPVQTEQAHEVHRRTNLAGGAANCARVLAALGTGRTYLWGVGGRSPWGRFSDVLEQSHIYDAAPGRVVLRGIVDQFAKTNTITRVVLEEPGGKRQHRDRFDDSGDVLLTSASVAAVTDHLNAARRECGDALHAILLYDLELGTLTKDVVNAVAVFCDAHGIPLFVDPKRDLIKFEDLGKYENIPAKVVIPNRYEWAALVGEKPRQGEWAQMIDTQEGLLRIARTSFARLPMFSHHIIKCDKYGAVLIGPADEEKNTYSARSVAPHPAPPELATEQLGFGDVMSAVFAREFSALSKRPAAERTHDPMLEAFNRANAVVACYRAEQWHRMPSLRSILDFKPKYPEPKDCAVAPDELYVPKLSSISLGDYSTAVQGVVSLHSGYKTTLGRIVALASDTANARHIVVTGEGGSGKSQLIGQLKQLPGAVELPVDQAVLRLATLERARDYLQEKSDCGESLVIVDEAFKEVALLKEDRLAVPLLNAASQRGIRFVFVDADFRSLTTGQLSGSQFASRCELFELHPIASRPGDIFAIFAAVCLSTAKGHGASRVSCPRGVLKAFVRWFLSLPPETKSARLLVSQAREIARRAVALEKATSRTTLYIAPEAVLVVLPPWDTQAGADSQPVVFNE